ncbi:hypothetical protein Tsubulata_041384 [Turnera subulata]|uniref:Uncharacterized protein n=1 Tax=Turnera subulata TaxID=218843 RepID=A0A9Q0FUB0_9ROSI|nr:hypothetical protein Tsubulata_041384 [Turnera subulata]
MGNRAALLLLMMTAVLFHGMSMAMAREEYPREWTPEEREEFPRERTPEERERWEERGEGEEMFLLHDSKSVVETDAGSMRVVRSFGGRILERPMHIGFITMEPKSLFVPQYLDSSLILFVRRGIYTYANNRIVY